MTTWTTAGTDAPPGWVTRYLAVLGVDHETPSLAALTDLTRAHLRTVPFENITSILRRAVQPDGPVPPPDLEALLHNWERGSGGGVCFEISEMVGRLLGTLGYRASPVLGQIRFPSAHLAVQVELDGGRYLVDVGCGAPIFAPIPLDRTVELRRVGLAYRFRPGDAAEEWVQDRWIDDAWVPFARYDLRPSVDGVREAAYQRHHTPGQSWVVDLPRLVRCAGDAVYTLRGDEFTHFSERGKRTERIANPADYVRLAAGVFRLPNLPIAAALSALAARQGAAPGT